MLFRSEGATPIALASLAERRYRHRPPLGDATIEDHVDVGIILKPLSKVGMQPRMIARHDEEVSHSFTPRSSRDRLAHRVFCGSIVDAVARFRRVSRHLEGSTSSAVTTQTR